MLEVEAINHVHTLDEPVPCPGASVGLSLFFFFFLVPCPRVILCLVHGRRSVQLIHCVATLLGQGFGQQRHAHKAGAHALKGLAARWVQGGRFLVCGERRMGLQTVSSVLPSMSKILLAPLPRPAPVFPSFSTHLSCATE